MAGDGGSPSASASSESNNDKSVETKKHRDQIAAHVWQLYNEGAPLYTKERLRCAAKQLQGGQSVVRIQGFDGIVREHFVIRTLGENTEADVLVPYVAMAPIQRLVNDTLPREVDDFYKSITIYSLHVSPADCHDKISTCARLDTLDHSIKAWEASLACNKLVEILSAASLPRRITKVIGFGLGDLPWSRGRTQHAALLTLANAIMKLSREGMGSDQTVRCFVQDPAYTRTCVEVLAKRGVTVLEGVEGFLAVDDETIVLTMSPDVCVKQIVTELARPAIMVCDSVIEPMEGFDPEEWTKEKQGDKEIWISPYSTDPDSPRVHDMVSRHYVKFEFPEHEDFGDEYDIYVRKDTT